MKINKINNSKIISVSDVHLGYHRSNPDKFNAFLSTLIKNPPEYFTIDGDFLDLWRAEFDEIIDSHKETFKLLKTLGRKGTKIIYILGNHDYQIRKHKDFFRQFPNLKIYEDEYICKYRSKTAIKPV